MTKTPRTTKLEIELLDLASTLEAENERYRAFAQRVVAWYENAGNADPDQQSDGSRELWSAARQALKGES